jgi:hypothetical protein
MTKYIVAFEKPSSIQKTLPGSREQLACEIIAGLDRENFHVTMLIACEAESKLGTWHLMKKTAFASLEIDNFNEHHWRCEVAKFYKYDLDVQNAIENAFEDILDALKSFNRMCNNSQNFKDIEIVDEFNLGKAFEHIENNSHCQISDAVKKIFKVEYFNNQ